MLSIYPACFFKEESGYSVIFPDLNYTSTCGNTLDEAVIMAVDCLAGYIYAAQKDGEPIPPPSDISSINLSDIAAELDESAGEAFVNLITVDVSEYAKSHFEESVEKILTIPAWLNNTAIEHNINFSAVLQEALKTQLNIYD